MTSSHHSRVRGATSCPFATWLLGSAHRVRGAAGLPPVLRIATDCESFPRASFSRSRETGAPLGRGDSTGRGRVRRRPTWTPSSTTATRNGATRRRVTRRHAPTPARRRRQDAVPTGDSPSTATETSTTTTTGDGDGDESGCGCGGNSQGRASLVLKVANALSVESGVFPYPVTDVINKNISGSPRNGEGGRSVRATEYPVGGATGVAVLPIGCQPRTVDAFRTFPRMVEGPSERSPPRGQPLPPTTRRRPGRFRGRLTHGDIQTQTRVSTRQYDSNLPPIYNLRVGISSFSSRPLPPRPPSPLADPPRHPPPKALRLPSPCLL